MQVRLDDWSMLEAYRQRHAIPAALRALLSLVEEWNRTRLQKVSGHFVHIEDGGPVDHAVAAGGVDAGQMISRAWSELDTFVPCSTAELDRIGAAEKHLEGREGKGSTSSVLRSSSTVTTSGQFGCEGSSLGATGSPSGASPLHDARTSELQALCKGHQL